MNGYVKKTMPRRVNIADVARLAGCAPATVSRRLNHPAMVSPSVIKIIDNAIENLGYVRNDSARSLRSSRSRLVGAIIPTLRHSIYAEMLSGLQNTLEKHGFALIHNTSDYNLDEEYRRAHTLVERGVGAIVLVGTRHRAKTFDLLAAHGINCVLSYALHDDLTLTSIGFDNYRAAALAATRLYELGHRHFGMIAGLTAHNDRAQARVDGFVETLLAKGIERRDIILREAPYGIGAGSEAFAALLAERTAMTALFCGSDILAVGAMYECRVRGIAIPDELSIIGFDNLEMSQYVYPPLTTLNVPAYEMGVEAGQYIVHGEAGNSAPKRVELGIDYIERATTKARY